MLIAASYGLLAVFCSVLGGYSPQHKHNNSTSGPRRNSKSHPDPSSKRSYSALHTALLGSQDARPVLQPHKQLDVLVEFSTGATKKGWLVGSDLLAQS